MDEPRLGQLTVDCCTITFPPIDLMEILLIDGFERGVFAREDIPTNTFLCKYEGDVITKAESKEREKSYQLFKSKIYLFQVIL